MTEITISGLYNWQKDTINSIMSSGTGLHIIKSVRQVSGKTYMLQRLILISALLKKSRNIFVSPTHKQNDRVFMEIKDLVRDFIELANQTAKYITLKNGSKIYFISAEAMDSVRGYTVDGICCVDEACYISDDFINILLPLVSKFKAPMVFASTPDRMAGFFYEQYTKGLNGAPGISTYNWSEYINEMYTKDELEWYAGIYSKRRFTTEILGEFITSDGAVFTGIDGCIMAQMPENRKVAVLSIDWGSGQGKDNTAVVGFNDESQMVYLKYFNDLTPVEQIDKIARIVKELNPQRIVVEQNSIGNVYYDMLKRAINRPVMKFLTDNRSKNDIIDGLQAAVENRRIGLFRDEELFDEMKSYEPQTTKTGKITYNAAGGHKDDIIMAMAIGYNTLTNNKGRYNITIK